MTMPPLYTIGHGTRSIDELAGILTGAGSAPGAAAGPAVGVVFLADVRRFPASRRSPQFAREALAGSLPARGIRYEWWGETLGGRRRPGPAPSRHLAWREEAFRAYAEYMDTPAFRQAFERLLAQAATEVTAVMCAETVWWRCHRRLLADAAACHGRQVVHLLKAGHAEAHELTPFARRGDDGWPVYDVGVSAPLL
jgi:uncharacterized protein (DUF488 family)